LIQECKNSNKNLIKYLDRERIKQLIDLITVMPEIDEHKRGHKYPFVANEVFNCDIQEVIDKFFIAPCDDVVPEPDEPAEDEDSSKFESGFEKDKEDSNTDSDDEESGHQDMYNSGADQDSTKVEDMFENNKVEEIDDEEAQKEDESASDAKQEEVTKDSDAEVLDVSDKVEEKSLDTDASKPEETATSNDQNTEDKKEEKEISPSTEESKNETPEETQNNNATKVITEETVDSSTPTTEAPKESEDNKEQVEITGEVKVIGDKENTTEDSVDQQTKEGDESTHISEETSEAATLEKPHTPLSDNQYDLLDYLTGFIDTENELNDVLSGYFSRLCNILLQKKSIELAKYFYTNEKLLYKFAYHSYSKSLTDTIIKILDINTDKIEVEEAEIERIRKQFVRTLLERLGDDKSEVSHEYSLNIFQIFNELTFKKPFYSIFIEEEVLNTLGDILKKDSPECSSNAAIRILNVLVSHLRDHLSNSARQKETTHFMDDNDDVVIEDEESNKNNEEQSIEEKIASHHLIIFFKEKVVDFLVAQLDKTPEKSHIDFQYGDNQFVLGKKRLACINLMESLVEMDDANLKAKILETDFYSKLFDCFLEYRYNTFLQLHLDNIFMSNLRDQNTTNEVKVEFLTKLGIFTKLPAFWNDNQMFAFPSQREFRHGYLAFTTKFANVLKEVSKNIPEVQEMADSEEWKRFLENDVELYNEKNSIVLANRGGGERKNSDYDEDDRFEDQLEERDDLEAKEGEDDYYNPNPPNSMRDTLQGYDPNKARDEHEEMAIDDNFEKDEEEDGLFSGLDKNARNRNRDDDSDDDKPIGGFSDEDDDDDSENEKEDVSENSDYYDNSYWQVNQFNIDDLLQG